MTGLGLGLGVSLGGLALRNAPATASARLAGNAKGYALGDSRVLDSLRAATYTNVGPHAWARSLLKGRLSLELANINGVGGARTDQILTTQFPAALASDAKTLMLLAGTNDCRSGTTPLSASVANLNAIIDQWVASSSDRIVIIADEAPWDPASTATGDQAQQMAIRDHIRSRHSPRNGVYVWPLWQAVTGGNDGFTPLSDTYRTDPDGARLHWAVPGGVRGGLALAKILDPLLPANGFFARPVTAGGDFTGTGIAPTGWSAPSGAGITTRMETADGLNWLVVELAGVLGTITLSATATAIPPGFTAGTTNVQSSIRYRVDANSQNIRLIGLQMNRQGGTALKVSGANNATDIAHMGSSYDPNGSIPADVSVDGVLYTPIGIFAADATQLRPWFINITSRTSLPMSGTIRFALPQTVSIPV